MPLIDLDEARAARREKAGEPITFRFAGETFTLPHELPLPSEALVEEAKERKWSDKRFITAWLTAVLGQSEWDRFWSLNPTYPDLIELFDKAMTHYGTNPGESSPSASSSRKAGGSSKRKSSGSTTRTPAAT